MKYQRDSAGKKTADECTKSIHRDICRSGISLYATFAEKVAEYHTNTALVSNGMKITYGDLKSSADVLSSSLAKLGVVQGSSIVVKLSDAVNAVVMSLAALKLNAILTPITENTCEKEITQLVASDDTWLVYDTCDDVAIFGNKAVEFNRLLTVDGKQPGCITEVADDANVYCSYHLGRKKLISQGRLKAYLEWFDRKYPVKAHDVILHKVTEDAMHSIVEVLWPLLTGAVIAVFREQDSDVNLTEFIQAHSVTHAHFTPTELNKLVSQTGDKKMLASLRAVFCSGELLAQSIVDRFMQLAGTDVQLIKLFNSPAHPGAIAYAECARGVNQEYVCKAMPLTQDVLVLDGSLAQVPHGAVGKIFVRQTA
jgi:acyl-coenzyme A synthetase/AMP-(fatty) acid ligase